MHLARAGRERHVFSLARLFEGNADTGQCPTKSDREDVSCQHMNSDKDWPLREAHRLVDDGIDLELVGEPRAVVVASVRLHAKHDARHVVPTDNRREHSVNSILARKSSLAHAAAVVTVLNGILEDAALALRLVPDITVLLVHTDHDAWHLGPADNRREHSARCIITSKTICAHASAVDNGERDHFLFRHCWQCEQDGKQGFRQKWLVKVSRRRRLMFSIPLLFRS